MASSKQFVSSKRCWGRGATGIFTNGRSTLARVVITCTDPAIPLLAIHPRAMFAHGYHDSCIRECIATLLILVKPSETTILTTEWIDRLWHIQMVGYPTAVEMNELLLYSQRGWVSNIMLNKRNRTEGYIVCNTVSFLQL